MLAFSNFGSNPHPSARKVRRAVEIAREREPGLMIDGEMQADTAVTPAILEEHYPWSELKGGANILIFPELQSANTAYKLIWRLAGAEAIGPILLGMARPVHVLQKGVGVSDIVSMAAICVFRRCGICVEDHTVSVFSPGLYSASTPRGSMAMGTSR